MHNELRIRHTRHVLLMETLTTTCSSVSLALLESTVSSTLEKTWSLISTLTRMFDDFSVGLHFKVNGVSSPITSFKL
ncbi:hypothetical protein LINPERPRIM_LOCUS14891 [Linum perenne]